MKYDKLRELTQNEKKIERLRMILGLLCIFMAGGLPLILVTIIVTTNYDLTPFIWISQGIAAILCVTTIIFNFKANEYSRNVYDYICVEVMNIIVETGIETSNFEMIEEADTNILYIGLHNQQVDYDDLSSNLNSELDEMNKIAGRNIRVKLI